MKFLVADLIIAKKKIIFSFWMICKNVKNNKCICQDFLFEKKKEPAIVSNSISIANVGFGVQVGYYDIINSQKGGIRSKSINKFQE